MEVGKTYYAMVLSSPGSNFTGSLSFDPPGMLAEELMEEENRKWWG